MVLPGYLCCPSKLRILWYTGRNRQGGYWKEKETHLTAWESYQVTNGTVHRKVLLIVREMGPRRRCEFFIKNVVRHNQCKPVLTKLFKSMLLMYGRDCVTLHTEPCSKELNNLLTECFIELLKRILLSKTFIRRWRILLVCEQRRGSASYVLSSIHKSSSWAKFIQLFIQATHDLYVIHQIWCEVAPHLSHCSHVPSAYFRTQCQYALFCQGYRFKTWNPRFAELSGAENPAYRHMTVPKSLVNCCVGAIRAAWQDQMCSMLWDRMPVLPLAVKEQLLLRHIFITE